MTKKATVKKTTKKKSTHPQNSDNKQICAVLAYFFVGIIWYFADEEMKKNSYVTFHIKQALVLLIVDVTIWIANAILGFLMPLWMIAWIGLFVLWIIGLVQVINKEEKEVPLIGQFAKNFKF
ncbi:hypothetical protein K9M74_01505 [Candidatus Woesearchaeota archaeon]|nr:hypothetical protein [Candidatus Woesearchaeota archaeon]